MSDTLVDSLSFGDVEVREKCLVVRVCPQGGKISRGIHFDKVNGELAPSSIKGVC